MAMIPKKHPSFDPNTIKMGYQILGKEVSNIGFGLMGLTWNPTTQNSDAEKIAIIKATLDAGVNNWNGGEFYGDPHGENSLTVLKKYFDRYPEDADKVSINIKGGCHMPMRVDNSPRFIRQCIDNCLNLIGDKGRIDMWEMARRVTHDEYLESLRVIDSCAKEGRIGGVALSEVNANTIRQAVKIVKVIGVEVELSLFRTEPLTNGVCEACAEFDIPIFAYSPLGKGLLTGTIQKPEEASPSAKVLPWQQDENFAANLRLVEQVRLWAAKKGCTPGQFAINWVASLSRRPRMPKIIPIPGASSVSRARENTREVELTDEDMDEVDAYLKGFVPAGERVHERAKAWIDSTASSRI